MCGLILEIESGEGRVWVVFGTQKSTLGVGHPREVIVDVVAAGELAGRLDGVRACCGACGGVTDIRALGVGALLGSSAASTTGYCWGRWCFFRGGFFGGETGFSDGFGFKAVGFLDRC